MKFGGILAESMIDYPGRFGPVIFTCGCNLGCSFCHNSLFVDGKSEIINQEEIESFLKDLEIKVKRGWYDGITISGGEPTLQNSLIYFIRDLKGFKNPDGDSLSIKLDTNGSNYMVLGKLLEEKLVDYVAMDVKGPPGLYRQIVNKQIDLREDVEKGIGVVQQFPDYEFRTTIVPIVRDNGISFMTPGEIGETAKFICDNTGRNDHKYFLQRFVPRKGELIDPRLEEFPETSGDIISESLKAAEQYLPNVKKR